MSKKKNKLLKQGRARRRRAQKKKLAQSVKHYYQLKGKTAEEVLQLLAQKTFLTDWCYPNPSLPNGNELCDLLVVFDNIAIIWQVKDVKLKDGHIKDSDFEKNIKQISGAYRQLFELQTEIELLNPRRGKENFEPSKVSDIYLISAFLGDSPFSITSMHEIKGKLVHTFTRDFTQIALNELDTISDFVDYLKSVEQFHIETNDVVIEGGEEELLGYYLKKGRNFEDLVENQVELICLGKGIWQDVINRPEYKAKKRADGVSYFWDYLIDICHTGDNPEYEIIARELARLNRFERRNMATAFTGLRKNADKGNYGLSYRRTIEGNDVTYCFLCHGSSNDDNSREARKSQLKVFCHIARGQHQSNSKVIGIATDQKITGQTAFDFYMMDLPEWTDKEQEIMELNMRDTGILTKPKEHHAHYEEYPEV